ncbi:kinesin-like protein KIN-14U [Citrus sinensis]|uniref:Kinesin-like protein KIN-14U n=1 Tax=Citrus sinensis TaxID=2711 RepID=A0ACB8KJ21_CITSI|nr:kinesin-like protein KIN-14U [Citrus sinensis]
MVLDKGPEPLKSSPMESTLESSDGLPPVPDLPDSPPLPLICTDVNVVPEQQKNELEQSIINLEGEIVELRLKKRRLDEKRREALNKILDIKGCIRVFCRVRSFLVTGRRVIHEPVLTELEKVVVRSGGSKKEFGFDKVFNQAASQEDVFVEVEPILRSALDGHNVCVLAYGQTGTGKTFTMDGTSDQPGIVPRALEELFRQATLDNSSSVSFSMSMLEVYLGSVRDLLAPKPVFKAYDAATRCNLNIQTDAKGTVEIEGLTEVQIPDFTKARWCLMRITIFRHGDGLEAKTEVSKLWMVDLGGSERVLKTGATGQTLDEGRAINLSLSALADVIAALRRKRGHVPYRQVLCWLLFSAFNYPFSFKLDVVHLYLHSSVRSDGSKVLMLVHASPCEEDVGETICSLSFAKRARGIESKRELSEDLKKRREIRMAELEEDMREAEVECQNVRNQIKEVESLLSEKKKLFSATCQSLEDEEKSFVSPKENLKEAAETPKASKNVTKRSVSNSVPRFMTSTVASRQRKNAAEKEISIRARSLITGSRSSAQFSCSQSLSFLDIRFKAMIRCSNKKPRYGETNTPVTESPKGNVGLYSKTTSMPRNKVVTYSDPNLKVTLSRHRRRMSDFV